MKFLFLLAIFGVNSIAAQSIFCMFSGTGSSYACDLLINNPTGHDGFITIPSFGHSTGYNDLRVQILRADQSTISLNFPRIFCDTFINLRTINMQNLQIQDISEFSFSNCTNLMFLNLANNAIANIHPDAFLQNIGLDQLTLSNNLIKLTDPTIFDGNFWLTTLSLDKNPLGDMPDDIFSSLLNLRTLHLQNTSLTLLRPEWFENLFNLITLNLYNNELVTANIPGITFKNLINLQNLQLQNTTLTSLNPEWFQTLSNLITLQLSNNQLNELPANVFKNLLNLQILQLSHNNLEIIPSYAFPCRMGNLITINVESNLINAVDPEFFNLATNLRSVNFNDNLCITQSYSNFYLNRESYLLDFEDCVEEFYEIYNDKNVCRFYNDDKFGYTCELRNRDFTGGTFEVTRFHTNCMTDSQVTGMTFKGSKIVKIPNEIYSTFPNLVYLQASNSKIEEAPTDCGANLKFMNLSRNSIRNLDSDAFGGCPVIEELILDGNCVGKVQPCEKTFVENVKSLKKLSMKNCNCVNDVFDLQLIRIEIVEEKMRKCFKMWYLM